MKPDPLISQRLYFRMLVEEALPLIAAEQQWPVSDPLELLRLILAHIGASLPAEPIFANLPEADLRQALSVMERLFQEPDWFHSPHTRPNQ